MLMKNVMGRSLLGICGAMLLVGGIWAADKETKKAGPNPYTAKKDLTPEQLSGWLVKMRTKPITIRLREKYGPAVIEAADRVLGTEKEGANYKTAWTLKMETLHEMAMYDKDGKGDADAQLIEIAKQNVENKDEDIADAANFYVLERRVLDAAQLPNDRKLGLVEEVEEFLEENDVAEKHLRMASGIIEILNSLPEDKDIEARESTNKLGKLLAASKELKVSKYGKSLIKDAKKKSYFDEKIDLKGTTIAGDDFDLASLRGKVVLVDFWATWCGPCVALMPELKKLHQEFHSQGFEIVGVSLDKDRAALDTFLKANELPWINLHDSDEKLGKQFSIESIPRTFLLDKDGKVIGENLPAAKLVERINGAFKQDTL